MKKRLLALLLGCAMIAGAFGSYTPTAYADVYYNDTLEEWSEAKILEDNDGLANATIHCANEDTVYTLPQKNYDYELSDIVKIEFFNVRDIFAGIDRPEMGIGMNLTMSDGKEVYIDGGHEYNYDYDSSEGSGGKYQLNDLKWSLSETESIQFSVADGILNEQGKVKNKGRFTVNIHVQDLDIDYNQSVEVNAIDNPVSSIGTSYPLTRKISLDKLQEQFMSVIARTDIIVKYTDSTESPLWSTILEDFPSGFSCYNGYSASDYVYNSKIYPEGSIDPALKIYLEERYQVEYVLGKDPEEMVIGETYPLVIKYMGKEVTTYITATENETEYFDYDYDSSGGNNDDDTHTHTPGNAVQENIRAASCVTNGSYDETVYCSKCGDELSRQSKTIPATGHTWDSGKIIKAATTKENGIKRFTCTKCHAAREEMTEKLKLKTQSIQVSSKASKTVTYKSSALKKKSASFNISAKAKGKVTYKITKGSAKNIKVSAKGKVTLKKGCKKGTYKIKVTAQATSVYQKAAKTIVIKVK